MICVDVRAQPGARSESVAFQADGTLHGRVRAPAVDGRANAAVLSVLARAARLRRRPVRLVSGDRVRQKRVEIGVASVEDLRQRIATKTITGGR
jgi:uncharacterized protein YggU (UPF0235/DUF167 family)